MFCATLKRYFFLGFEEERPAVEVAADEVAEDLAEVDDEDGGLENLVGGGNEEVEGIGDGVGEAAEDEDGYAQHQRQHLALAGELYGGGHDESAADGEQETGPRAFRQTTCKDLRGGFHAVGLGIGDHPGREQTAHDVAQEYHAEHGPVALPTDESGCACVELQTVIDHGGKSEGEEDGASDAAHSEVDHTADGDTDTSQNGQGESET